MEASITSLLPIFTTGLLTGGLTCLAVQGGLLASTLAQREEERLKDKVKDGNALPIFAFLGAKLIAYTILGFLLGWLGSLFQLSLTAQVILQFAVVIFMVGTALNILNIHPIFRYFVIQPPRFLTRLVRKQSKSKDMFAPALLGAFTVFIPCGTTQAMMALAIASGSPLYGAAILFAFVLGTSPVFFLLGYFATKFGDVLHQKFMQFAAYAIILLAVFNFNNTISLTGSRMTLQNFWSVTWCTVSFCEDSAAFAMSSDKPVTEATILVEPNGYNPSRLSVRSGSAVTLHLVNNNAIGCTQAFTIPKLNIQKIITKGNTDTVTFTAPSEKGEFTFMCGMGMYGGVIKVI